jgi:hypothetical protein
MAMAFLPPLGVEADDFLGDHQSCGPIIYETGKDENI